jgi:hypothetical protein
MAATGFENWITAATTPERIALLRQHIAALSQRLATPDVSADGKSASYATLQREVSELRAELKELEARPDAGGRTSPVSVASFEWMPER